MKVIAAAIYALVALTINASVSSASQEASMHLQVRPKVTAVEAYTEEPENSKDSVDFANETATSDAEQEDSVSESEDDANDDDDDDGNAALPKAKHLKTFQRTKMNVTALYDFNVCTDTEASPWTKQIEYACVVNDAYGAHDFYYRLDNGTYLCNYFCESADRAGMDRVFQDSMHGQVITSKERANAMCYSKYHAKFSLTTTKYASESDYVLSLFEKIAHSPRCVIVNH